MSDDIENQTYCKANQLRKLDLKHNAYKWFPSMLEFYWQCGIDENGLEFLKSTGFIYSYE